MPLIKGLWALAFALALLVTGIAVTLTVTDQTDPIPRYNCAQSVVISGGGLLCQPQPSVGNS